MKQESRESTGWMPKREGFPAFMLGLTILIFGGLGAKLPNAPLDLDVTLGVVGFIFVLVSVATK